MRIFAANLLENKSNVDRILKKNRSRINTATAASLVSPHFRKGPITIAIRARFEYDSTTIRLRFERDTTSYEELCAFEQ